MLALVMTPSILSCLMGWLILKGLTPQRNSWSFFPDLVTSTALGISLSVMIAFSSFLFFNHWHPIYVLLIHAILILCAGTIAFFRRQRFPISSWFSCSTVEWVFLIILILACAPLWYQVFFYAYGGWDAWSTWNLKAKFLFLGGENWQNLFDPKLWRSSPHYPIFLPLANVWSWVFQSEALYQGPAFNAFFMTWLTAALLTFSLYHFTKSRAAIWPALMLLTMPFYNKLALSQYADNVVAFYLLLSGVLWVKSTTEERPMDLGLCGFFLGLMCFIKNEGLLSAGWLTILIIVFLLTDKTLTTRKRFLAAFVSGGLIGVIPSLIFYIVYAPDNITFVNGLVSAAKPATALRLKTIFGFYSLEFFSPFWNIIALFRSDLEAGSFICKWNGIWILLTFGLGLSLRQCLRRPLWIFAFFIPGFMAVITAYYWINTYFEIEWWLQVSLNRIISGFLPLLMFWVFLALWHKTQK